MGRSNETYNKKEVRKKKEKKRKEKEKKRQERKENQSKSSLDDMIAYVDENGNITSTPPEEQAEEIDQEDIEIGVPKKSEEEKADTIKKGRLTYFNDSKGYGFIKDFDSGESVFVHVKNVLEPINEGNIVTYTKEKGPKGPTAVNVKPDNS